MPLTPYSLKNLSTLRNIGWSLWDPIGLMPHDETWTDPANRYFADEYDSYLLRAADQLQCGAAVEDVVLYLMQIESDYMALGERPDTRARAVAVVDAIRRI